jgi:hypothetical protein
MGAMASIDMVLPPRIHLCMPEKDTTGYTNSQIQLLEEKLKDNWVCITKTITTHSIKEMQNTINSSAMIIVFLTSQTPCSYFQAREIDYAKQGYRKIFYILLDVKYSQTKNDWIRNFIGQDEWVQYDKNTWIDSVAAECVKLFNRPL